MLCEICKKNEATIHIQEIVNKQKKALNICQECAAKKSGASGIFDATDIAKFLYNITANIGGASGGTLSGQKKGGSIPSQLFCQDCGWDSAKFAKTGRLGCAKCYAVFKELLAPALKNMHKGIIHVGKTPAATSCECSKKSKEPSTAARIKELQKQLEECVMNEEFEKAACLRDEIAVLKKKSREKQA